MSDKICGELKKTNDFEDANFVAKHTKR
jgi:hypothetical protein